MTKPRPKRKPENCTSVFLGAFSFFTLFFVAPLHSVASPRRVEECGVERYIAKADPSCGVKSYLPARDPVCGVELYKEGFSMSCPGSSPQDTYSVSPLSTNAAENYRCKPGYAKYVEIETDNLYDPSTLLNSPSRYLGLLAGSEHILIAPHTGPYHKVTCTRPNQPGVCRLPEFGVELYKECRDQRFGVESYSTCERPEFGVASYNECEIRKTKTELAIFIQNLDQNLDVMGVALLTNEATLLKSEGSEIGLACFIKRWNQDPLYVDLVAELKIQFTALFGVNYNPGNYDCSNQARIDIPANACDANDTTSRCKALRAYKAARTYLDTNKAEVAALIDDFVARADSSFKEQLESLNLRILKYLQ